MYKNDWEWITKWRVKDFRPKKTWTERLWTQQLKKDDADNSLKILDNTHKDKE